MTETESRQSHDTVVIFTLGHFFLLPTMMTVDWVHNQKKAWVYKTEKKTTFHSMSHNMCFMCSFVRGCHGPPWRIVFHQTSKIRSRFKITRIQCLLKIQISGTNFEENVNQCSPKFTSCQASDGHGKGSVGFLSTTILDPIALRKWAKLWGFLALHSIILQRLSASQSLTAANSTQWNSYPLWFTNTVTQAGVLAQ